MFFSVVIYCLAAVIPDTAYTSVKWRTQSTLCSLDQAQINMMQLGLENIFHTWGKISS